MTFLAPLAGIIAASIATPLLLLLYFLKLRRRPVRISSTLLWEQAVRDLQVNAPFRWLRPSLLLLLQLLALASFCLALARPAIDAESPTAGRTIILIDRSASMNAPAGNDADRLQLAKERALELIDRLDDASIGRSGRAEAVVVAFAASARALTSFTSAPDALRRAVRSIEPTDQPADLNAALRLAQALVMQSMGEEDASVRVVLLGDGSYETPDASIGLGQAEFRFVRIGPPPDAPRDNLGIVALAARRDLDDASLVRIFTRVLNAGETPVTTSVSLLIDGEPVRARDVAIDGRTDEAPAETALTFEYIDTPTGEPRVATVWIGRDDALSSDNAAALRLDPVIPPRVLIISPPTQDEPARLARRLLTEALSAIGANIVDTVDAGAYARLAESPDLAGRYDLLVFDSVRPARLPPIPSISFGAGLPLDGVRLIRSEQPGGVRFAAWRRSHPILRQVSLDGVIASNTSIISLDDDARSRFGAVALASGPNGPLMTLLRDNGDDRLIIGFPLAESNWPVNVSFVVFLTNAIEQMTRLIGETTGVSYTTTEPISVRAAPGARTVRAQGPARLEVEADPDTGEAVLGVLDRAGVYELDNAAPNDRFVPVNLLDARESAIETADEVRISGEAVRAGSLAAAAPREIWQWFVLLGFLLLTLEWLLYAWRMRV